MGIELKNSKVGACKIIGVISGLLALILIIISGVFLARILGCNSHSGHGGAHNPILNDNKDHIRPQFGNDVFRNPFGPGAGQFGPPGNRGFGGDVRRQKRNAIDDFAKAFNINKLNVTTFTASAICGIIFGLLQLIFAIAYLSYVNEKNCVKSSFVWLGLNSLIVIALLGVFIAMLTVDWNKIIPFGLLNKNIAEHHKCFGMNSAFIGIVGADFILLIICCACSFWCAKKSNDCDEQQEQVTFNQQ